MSGPGGKDRCQDRNPVEEQADTDRYIPSFIFNVTIKMISYGEIHQKAKPLLFFFSLKIRNYKRIQKVPLIWMSENFLVSLLLLILRRPF